MLESGCSYLHERLVIDNMPKAYQEVLRFRKIILTMVVVNNRVVPMGMRIPFRICFKKCAGALAGVAQWIEHWPVTQKVAGSIPSQGTFLSCGPGPQ